MQFGDPLVLPAFNIINATIGMFLTGFMILGIYYSNAWYTAYLPINSYVFPLAPERSFLSAPLNHLLTGQ